MSKLRALLPLCLALALGACAGEPAKSDDGGKADGAKDTGDKPEEPAATAEPAAGETGAAEPAAETGAAAAGETGEAAADETGEAAAGETGEAADGETGEAPEAAAEDGGDAKKDDDEKGDNKKKGGDKKAAKADLELGKKMYLKKCKNCHAPDGAGSEKFAKKVDNLPSLKKTKLSLAKVKKITMNGVPDTKMKGYKSKLSAEEIDAVAAFVKTL